MMFNSLINAIKELDLYDVIYNTSINYRNKIIFFRLRKTGHKYIVAKYLFSFEERKNFYYQQGLFISSFCNNARKDYFYIAEMIIKEIGNPVGYINIF